jgi:hypothetical protein
MELVVQIVTDIHTPFDYTRQPWLFKPLDKLGLRATNFQNEQPSKRRPLHRALACATEQLQVLDGKPPTALLST